MYQIFRNAVVEQEAAQGRQTVAQGCQAQGCGATGGGLLGHGGCGPLHGAPSIAATLRWGRAVLTALLQAAVRPGTLQERRSLYAFELKDQALVLGKLKVDNLLREEEKLVYLSHFDCCGRTQTDKTRNNSLLLAKMLQQR